MIGEKKLSLEKTESFLQKQRFNFFSKRVSCFFRKDGIFASPTERHILSVPRRLKSLSHVRNTCVQTQVFISYFGRTSPKEFGTSPSLIFADAG